MLLEESYCSIVICGREVEGYSGLLEGDGGDGRLEAYVRMDFIVIVMGGKEK